MKKYLVLLTVLVIFMSGCGASKTSENMASSAGGQENYVEEAQEMEMAADQDLALSSTSEMGTVKQSVENGKKLIKEVGVSVETKEFDPLIDSLNKMVKEIDGYIEQSTIDGSSQNVDSSRYATLVVRVPQEKLDDFLDTLSEAGNITHRQETVTDVTLEYKDIESHKKALEKEQERLMELMEKAKTVEDLISIESRLSQVRYELESYESRLRTIDNQVDYSTVTIDICEVERITPAQEKGFFAEIISRWSENIQDIASGAKILTIWLLGSLPNILVLAAVVAVIILLIKRVQKKRALRSAAKERSDGL